MTQQLINTIAQAIYDKKGHNILALDVRGISTMADYFIIAEGTVDRHVKALCSAIKHAIYEQGFSPDRIEGEQDGDWIVIDCGDIVIHLFIPDLRERYALEELWKEAQIVNIKLKLA